MKKIFLIGLVLVSIFALAVSSAFAANEPYLISFQGKLEGVTSPVNVIRFELYDDPTAGSLAWSENHNGVDLDDNGIFNLLLGNTTPLEQDLYDNAENGLWMKVIVSGTPLAPRQALTAAPFAFVAKNLKGGVVDAFKDTSTGSAVFGRAEGSDSSGVRGESALYYGVYGNADDMAGVFGESGGNGIGVLGRSTGGHGVFGDAAVADRAGVYGKNNNSDGYGVIGESNWGYGVFGVVKGADRAGVYGKNINVADGYGVMGQSTGGYGVYGTSETSGKAGVYGTNSAGYGVFGEAEAAGMAGVYGKNNNADGYGVMGQSTDGHGVYGTSETSGKAGVYGTNSAGYGVYGVSDAANPLMAGVLGKSGAATGVIGIGSYGVIGSGEGVGVYGVGTNSYSVYGVKGDDADNDSKPAVYGENKETHPGSNPGVKGKSKVGFGVYGVNENDDGNDDNAAVYGIHLEETIGDNPGVKGFSRAGYGVYGYKSNDNDNDAKAAVYGKNEEANDGDNPGVKGESTSGYGVYGYKADDGYDSKAAVYGKNEESTAGDNPGVKGESVAGYGVYGEISSRSPVESAAVAAVYGENTYSDAFVQNAYGIGGHFVARGKRSKGLVGEVLGYSAFTRYGIYGRAEGVGGVAVCGIASDTNIIAGNIGGKFVAGGGNGVGVKADTFSSNHEWGVYTGDKMWAQYGFFTSGNSLTQNGFNSSFSDIAEWIGNVRKDVEAGDVVVADPDNAQSVIKSTSAYDSSVIGIISTNPGYLGGDDLKEELGENNVAKLALAGVVSTKVSAENGAIKIGDLLTTSNTPGHAMKATNPQIGTIVGKALEALPGGTGKIRVLVTLQ